MAVELNTCQEPRTHTLRVLPPAPPPSPFKNASRRVMGTFLPIRASRHLYQQVYSGDVNGFVQDLVKQMQGDLLEELLPSDPHATLSSLRTSELLENLGEMTKYYFQQGGKMLRPTIALLMASACNSATQRTIEHPVVGSRSHAAVCQNQYKIGMIAEMIHTASLVHDDVIDEATARRGNASVNAVWGNKMSVLVGDYILARATQVLCSIGRPYVISTMARIIQDLVVGEFLQTTTAPKDEGMDRRIEEYIKKTYHKTASLFANSCKSAAILTDENDKKLHSLAFEYGRNLGIAFQLVDDTLDFVATSDELGKPVAADLKLGLATGPVIFASVEYPELREMIAGKFSGAGEAEKAREIVLNSNGLKRTRELIDRYSHDAARLIGQLPNRSEASEKLIEIALAQAERKY
ncbi:unnamed protein product [Caenorhabditis auriculariae]|uniref:Uncharacterized protein n=1 Tax=Caenorhabditis auriculariae TaxID=2777116 RepID=A0A8S1HSJ5_9PELO|nr:unnamed protein product [Caenorhabditis auriculariae]